MTYRRLPDRFTKKAKTEGFAARSVYKLEEIDRRARLFRPGQRVLDLGAAPGSWTQYVAVKLGSKGRLVAVDKEPLRVAFGPNVTFVSRDVMVGPAAEVVVDLTFDVVLSDMAPKATGILDLDLAVAYELAERALDVALVVLARGGSLLVKVFQGDGFEALRARMRADFETVRVIKPEASRRESREIYLLAERRR